MNPVKGHFRETVNRQDNMLQGTVTNRLGDNDAPKNTDLAQKDLLEPTIQPSLALAGTVTDTIQMTPAFQQVFERHIGSIELDVKKLSTSKTKATKK